ncbi:MAG TPA: TolC family protein [Flavisolibacter sp.]|nr:TolC family protein [Flavisolibacter sp.]
MKKIKVLLGLVLSAATGLSHAQQKYELSVKEAVDLAYKNVIQVKNAQIDHRIQEAKNREILGQAYPQLTGNANATHYLKLPGFLFPDATSTAVYSILKNEGVSGSAGPITDVPAPTLTQVSFQQPWNLTAGATLSQLLFQPDVFVGLQARETALNLTASQVESIKETVKDSAYKRYYAILISQKQLDFLNQGLERLRKLYYDDSIMYVNGFAEKLELDKVQVQINNLTTTRNQVAAGITMAYAGLKFALGISQKDTVVLRDELTSASIRDNLLDTAFRYEDRPEIRTLDYVKQLQELDVKRYRLSYIPTVAAQANYSINGLGQKFFTHSSTAWIRSAFIGINIDVPIFDGFQRRYRIQQARLRLEQAENNITNLKQGIDVEQVITRQTLLTAISNLDIQESNMQLAEKVYNTTKLKFEQGVETSSFEVILAQSDLLTSQSNYFTALYNAVIARISYLRSLGKLQ